MEFTRSKIREYLDAGFKNTNYYKKVRGTSELTTLKSMSILDLDFIDILKEFYAQLNLNYNSFKSNAEWAPSARQQFLLETMSTTIDDISHIDDTKLKNNHDLHLYDDLFCQIEDYFDDYNNSNDQISKEEINLIIPILENFLNNYYNRKNRYNKGE